MLLKLATARRLPSTRLCVRADQSAEQKSHVRWRIRCFPVHHSISKHTVMRYAQSAFVCWFAWYIMPYYWHMAVAKTRAVIVSLPVGESITEAVHSFVTVNGLDHGEKPSKYSLLCLAYFEEDVSHQIVGQDSQKRRAAKSERKKVSKYQNHCGICRYELCTVNILEGTG